MSQSNDLTPEGLEQDIKAAKERGFDVVMADDKTLLLDLDTPEALAQYARVLPIVTEKYGLAAVETWPSKGGNTHVRITLSAPHEPLMRYALQAALGSDGVRETLNLCRHLNGCVEASILFKPVQPPEPVF